MTTNENLVLNLPYNEIYDRIVMLKKGAYQLDSNNEDDVENCKWLAAIFDVFIDLPLYVSTRILVKSNIKFDYDLFLAENHNPSSSFAQVLSACPYEANISDTIDLW